MKKRARKKPAPGVGKLTSHKLILTALLNLQERITKLENQPARKIGFNTNCEGFEHHPEGSIEEMEDTGEILGRFDNSPRA